MKTIRILSVLGLALLTAGPARANDDPLSWLAKYLWNGILDAGKKQLAEKAFLKKTQDCVVIENHSDQPWRFGWIEDPASTVNHKQVGTILVSYVGMNGVTLEDYPNLVKGVLPKAYGAEIDSHCHEIVVTAVSDGSLFSDNGFFRVCYLEDSKKNRFYLNLVREAGHAGPPSVGYVKNPAANTQPFELSKPAQTNMLIIRADGL